jgi:hypothetical protein
MKRSGVTENAYVEEKMTAGVRHAKTLCMVGIVMSIVCGVVDVIFDKMNHVDSWIGSLVAALLVRWLFDGLESIISLLCDLNSTPSVGTKFPDAAFPQQSSNVPDLRNIKMPEQAKYDSHETAGE